MTPARIFISVDFPAPFSPTTARTSPSFTVTSTALSTVVLPYAFWRPRPIRSGAPPAATRRSAGGALVSATVAPSRGEDFLLGDPTLGGDPIDEVAQVAFRDAGQLHVVGLHTAHHGVRLRELLARGEVMGKVGSLPRHLVDRSPDGLSLPTLGDERQADLGGICPGH